MATVETPKTSTEERDLVRERWLKRLDELVQQVDAWGRELDWATKTIEMKMEDSLIGKYKAPALILQKEVVRVLLEPIARSAPGTEGVVDLYLMPAYDDIATLFFYDGGWQLHYAPDGPQVVATVGEARHEALSKESLQAVLDEMIKNAT